MAIRAVIFDIGGVLELLRDPDLLAKQWQRLGLPKDEQREKTLAALWWETTLGRISPEEMRERQRKILGLSAEEMRAWRAEVVAQLYLNAELADFAQSLRPRYKTALLSNAFADEPPRLRAWYQIEERFDLVIYSCEVGMGKPEAPIFQYALERLGVQPEEAIFVDDVPANVEAARKLGIRAMQFLDTRQAIREIQAMLDAHP